MRTLGTVLVVVIVVGLAVYIAVELTWLAVILYLALTALVFWFRVVDTGPKKAFLELLKDFFDVGSNGNVA